MTWRSLLSAAVIAWSCAAVARSVSPNNNVKSHLRLLHRFQQLDPSVVVFIDGDNVRGKTAFKASKESLTRDIDALVGSLNLGARVCLFYDHGNENEAHLYNNLTVSFSGPHTADDTIVRDAMWFQRRFNSSILVVTSDSGLKSRCMQGAKITGRQLAVVDSTLFVDLLSASMPEEAFAQVADADADAGAATPPPPDLAAAMGPFDPAKMSKLRREMGVRNQIKSIEKYVRGGGSKKKMTKLKKRAQQLETRLQQVITRETGAVASLTATMDAALAMTPAHQQAGYDAIVRMMRSGSTRGREETWERVLLAERFRNVLLARAFASGRHELDAGTEAAVDDGALATYAREINRNFSKTNFTLERLRWQEAAAKAAAAAAEAPLLTLSGGDVAAGRPVEAVFMVAHLDPTTAPAAEAVAMTAATEAGAGADAVPSTLSSLHQQLLLQQRREKALLEASKNAPTGPSLRAVEIAKRALAGPRKTVHGIPFAVTHAGNRVYEVAVLGDAAEVTGADDEHGGDSADGEADEDAEGALPSAPAVAASVTPAPTDTADTHSPASAPALRIVAVSDTHGYESDLVGGVPDGDVLVHAGDYAGDRGKSGRKYKALDEWLARFPHPVKIVVRGNHDPYGAAFPLSKAVYAASATTITVKGVTFALAPYGTVHVPYGQVVISHEPPYGILDVSCMGKKKPHVGSMALHRSVERFDKHRKPQLWLFGHIHEGFGAQRCAFSTHAPTKSQKATPYVLPERAIPGSKTRTTLCVNVANANPGPAHSIDNVAVVIDVLSII